MDRAIEIGGDVKAIRQTRGAVLVSLGRYSEAKEQIFASRTDSDKGHEIALNSYFLARAHLGLGELADAAREQEELDRAIRKFGLGKDMDTMSKSLRKAIAAAVE